jgi:putative flippase GtrA
LILRYGGFAALAILANLGAQRMVLAAAGADGGAHSGAAFLLALAIGTTVGLALKYLLDRRWIFHDRTRGARAQGRQFALYSATGLFTTAIFWGSETAFWLIWRNDAMREAGAVLGLIVGYVVKYQADRRFVFAPAVAAGGTGR